MGFTTREEQQRLRHLYEEAPEKLSSNQRATRRYYDRNRDERKQVAHSQRQVRVERNREYVRIQKDRPCLDCGLKYPYYVMDFDHLRDKTSAIGNLVNTAASLQKIQSEIDKCQVVCSNCHRERTFQRNSAG